jgi:integrase
MSGRFSDLCQALGFEGLTFHGLRHTVVTKLIDKGVPNQQIMAITGHKSVVTLTRYYTPSLKAKRQTIALLDDDEPANSDTVNS